MGRSWFVATNALGSELPRMGQGLPWRRMLARAACPHFNTVKALEAGQMLRPSATSHLSRIRSQSRDVSSALHPMLLESKANNINRCEHSSLLLDFCISRWDITCLYCLVSGNSMDSTSNKIDVCILCSNLKCCVI